MGFAAGPLVPLSMDDFGFFSEASGASYSSGSKPRMAGRYDAIHQLEYYQQQDGHYQARAQASLHPHDYQHQRYVPQQQQQQQQQQHPHRLAPSDSGSDMATLSLSDSTSPTPAKRGSNLACLKCRAIKVKCWKSNPNDPRCSRCNRLDLFCEFREHHRGKKLEKVIADENRNVILTPDMLRQARRNMLAYSSYPLNIDLAAVAVPDNAEDAAYLAVLPSGSSSGRQISPMFANQSYGASGLALAGSPSPVGMASSVYDDVVQMNAVSWNDACYLYSLFITQLNPIVALLEPSLHSVQYTREQTPILFSTILSIASRFFRPALHPQCQAASAAIQNFASSRQLCSIDHIQALIVSAIWAAPGDTWRSDTIAAAIAYAYELGLPFCFEAGVAVTSATKPYTPPLPVHLLHASHQSTTLRVQQRTWIQLCLLELSQQSDSRRTSMQQKRAELIAANDFPNVRSWYELNHSTMSAYDTRLAYQLDFALSQRNCNRLVSTARSNMVATEELSRNIDALAVQEKDCFSTWFKTYGDENIPRYTLDRYSNTEANYFLTLHRFGRAVQLHTVSSAASAGFGTTSQLQERRYTTATELAFKVLDCFNSKVLDQDATSSSMLRFSPQYMASGCLAAARWLLPSDMQLQTSTKERARERVSETIRLLSQPQFYPDGNRVPTSSEIIGQLDQALRSLMGDSGMLIAPLSRGSSPKRARHQDKAHPHPRSDGHEWTGEGRKQRRRTSNDSPTRANGSVGTRSIGGMSESAGSDRADWSPHPTADRWKGGINSGYVSGSDDAVGLNMETTGISDATTWPPQLLTMPSTGAQGGTGSWTPTSEGALSNIAMASTSISPPSSEASAVFSVSATALPDHLRLGLPNQASGPYAYAAAPSSVSNPSLAETRTYDRQFFVNSTAAYPVFDSSAQCGNAALQSFPLARENTTTQQSYAAQQRYGGGQQQYAMAVGQGQQQQQGAVDLDASLTIGLSSAYGGGGEGAGENVVSGHQRQ